jgi:pyruvate,orthophosphate dikinase
MIHNINQSVHLFTQVSPINHEFLAVDFAAKAARGKNTELKIPILIPLVSDAGETQRFANVLDTNLGQYSEKVNVGAAIQTPKACLTAGKIATSGGFVVISLPQLTELTFGIIRKDAGWLKM